MSRKLTIPESELRWRFSRSSGPGGQHVNTSDTRAELLWSPAESDALSPAEKQRLFDIVGNESPISIVSSRFRSQLRNREDARDRLERFVSDAISPRRSRRRTRPTRASIERRLDTKRAQSVRKRERRGDWN
jgi:ribosome-associated protein